MVCVSSHISGASLALNILPRPAAESPFGILVADRIFRFGPAPDSAGHAHAIARMGARGPIGNVQRNPQRCPWALPNEAIVPDGIISNKYFV